MGEFLGLIFGLGLLAIAQSLWFPRAAAASEFASRDHQPPSLVDRGTRRGYGGQLRIIGAMVVSLIAGTIFTLIVTGSIVVSMVFGFLVGSLPLSIVLRRRSSHRNARSASWPDAVDDLSSAVRAGMSLPDAVAALAERGPVELRAPFESFASEYRRTGAFGQCLDVLRADLADPTGDRVIDALKLAREVGGTELGRLLRTLSQVLREDSRARAELVARQSWSINAARLAVAAPWITLFMMSLRPGTLACYDSATGALVLAIAALMSAIAYVIMRGIGRLPDEQRSRAS